MRDSSALATDLALTNSAAVQEATCIVIDQTVKPELLRGPLAKKLLQLVIARFVIPEQVSSLLRDKVVKDRLADIPIEGTGIDGHATTTAFSLRIALYATAVDGA